jgi:hypothetical protein
MPSCRAGSTLKKKIKAESPKATLARVTREMNRPRVAASARLEIASLTHRSSERPFWQAQPSTAPVTPRSKRLSTERISATRSRALFCEVGFREMQLIRNSMTRLHIHGRGCGSVGIRPSALRPARVHWRRLAPLALAQAPLKW